MVYIIILNYNNYKDTIVCLESVFKLNYPNFKVVVVDNASSDNSIKRIIEWAAGHLHHIKVRNPDLKDLVFPLIEKPIQYEFVSADKIGDISIKEKTRNSKLVDSPSIQWYPASHSS